MKKTIFLILCILCSLGAMAQKKSITGVITDGAGESIIGASVVEVGTTNGTITDFDGKFSLTIATGAKFTVSYIGYKSQTITVGAENTYNIVLKEDTEVLDEVVITGYGGSQKRATLTTAISKLDNSVLKNAAFSNAGQSLQGSVTGLRVVNKTGQPGSEPDITLRGGATITGDNSKALIVVDGIVRNSMSDINPSDIESIQVLKDAASTAIYGARANGGVILVETKSGKEGKASVNYKFKMGVNFARKGYDFCDAHDYIYYNRLGYKRTGRTNVDTQMGYGIGNNLFDIRYLTDENANLKNEGWASMADPFYDGKTILYKDYSGELDDVVFNNSALTQDHYVNITGGNDKGTFSASLGYYKEDGQIRGTGYERFNGALNGSYKVFPFLTVKANATYSWSTQPELWIGQYEFFYRTRSQRPTWNPWNEDGTPASGFGTGDGNPDYYRDKLTSENSTNKSTYSVGFALDILPKKLVLNGNASLYRYDWQREKFNKSYQAQSSATPDNTRQAEAYVQKYNQIQLNGTLTYTDTFAEKHNLEAMLGTEYFTYDQFDFEAKTQNSPTDDIPTLNAGSTRTYTSTTKTAYRILSGFGRINYNYDMRYLISFVARYDGISKLKDNRWGFFPGVSIGWRISEEKFFEKLRPVVDDLKIRASIGQTGTEKDVKLFDYLSGYTWNNGNAVLDGELVTGLNQRGLPITNLSWTKNTTSNIGFDLTMFNNRLKITADAFRKDITGVPAARYDVLLPSEVGYSLPNENLNKQAYIGAEGMVTWTDHIGDLNYTVSGNFTFSRYKSIETYKPRFNNSWDEYRNSAEGRWGGIYWGYQVIGQFQSEEEIRNYPVNLDGNNNRTLLPGDFIYKDVNGDGIINGMDERPIGYPEGWAPIMSFGGNIGLQWKGIDLNIDLSGGAMQGWRQNYELANAYHGNGNSPVYLLEDRWHRADLYDPDSEWIPGRYPAIRKGEFSYNNKNSDFWLHNVRYLRIKNLEVGYSLPAQLLRPIRAQKVRVYANVSNLCSFDNVGKFGVDPEITAAAAVVYPQQRTFLLGFNITY